MGGPHAVHLRRVEALLAVLADRLEQPVAGVLPVVVGHDQRSRHEPGQEVEHVVHVDDASRAHDLGGFEGEAAGEDRQACQQHLLRPG